MVLDDITQVGMYITQVGMYITQVGIYITQVGMLFSTTSKASFAWGLLTADSAGPGMEYPDRHDSTGGCRADPLRHRPRLY